MNGQNDIGRDPATPGSSAAGMPGPGTVPPAGAPPYGYAGAPSDYGVPPPYVGPQLPGLPNPATAVVLGFIPGVGAMYNGQFAKGIANIAVFAVFVSLADHASGVFGIFVAGWIAFMVFDAYQTARARRFGLPLPNPFGLNDIGERLGFGGSAPWSVGVPPTAPPPAPAPSAESFRVDPQGNVYGHRTSGAWSAASTATSPEVGNVSYAAEAGSVAYAAPPPSGTAERAGFPYAQPNYAGYGPPVAPPPPAWAGFPPTWNGSPPPFDPAVGAQPRSALASVPAGALWLIGLGILALLGSLHSFSFINGEFTGALFLIAFSAFLFFRRWQLNLGLYGGDPARQRWAMIHSLRGPSLFLVAGVLTLLQAARILRWENSWPFLLIFLGVWILVERVAYNRIAEDLYAGSPSPMSSASAAESLREADPTGAGTAQAGSPDAAHTPYGTTDDREGR